MAAAITPTPTPAAAWWLHALEALHPSITVKYAEVIKVVSEVAKKNINNFLKENILKLTVKNKGIKIYKKTKRTKEKIKN